VVVVNEGLLAVAGTTTVHVVLERERQVLREVSLGDPARMLGVVMVDRERALAHHVSERIEFVGFGETRGCPGRSQAAERIVLVDAGSMTRIVQPVVRIVEPEKASHPVVLSIAYGLRIAQPGVARPAAGCSRTGCPYAAHVTARAGSIVAIVVTDEIRQPVAEVDATQPLLGVVGRPGYVGVLAGRDGALPSELAEARHDLRTLRAPSVDAGAHAPVELVVAVAHEDAPRIGTADSYLPCPLDDAAAIVVRRRFREPHRSGARRHLSQLADAVSVLVVDVACPGTRAAAVADAAGIVVARFQNRPVGLVHFDLAAVVVVHETPLARIAVEHRRAVTEPVPFDARHRISRRDAEPVGARFDYAPEPVVDPAFPPEQRSFAAVVGLSRRRRSVARIAQHAPPEPVEELECNRACVRAAGDVGVLRAKDARCRSIDDRRRAVGCTRRREARRPIVAILQPRLRVLEALG
jgi:hypothetical protein